VIQEPLQEQTVSVSSGQYWGPERSVGNPTRKAVFGQVIFDAEKGASTDGPLTQANETALRGTGRIAQPLPIWISGEAGDDARGLDAPYGFDSAMQGLMRGAMWILNRSRHLQSV